MIGSGIQAQELSKKERKVTIFTSEEKDNLQMWMYQEVQKMDFNKEELDEYNATINYYIVKIARLDDKDKDLTKAELKVEVEKLLAKLDEEMKITLSEERYEVHQEIFGELIRAAYKRWGIH